MSYKLYPITNSPYECNDYTVKINGSTIERIRRAYRHSLSTAVGPVTRDSLTRPR